jgi:hypothetical protein
MSNEGHHKGLYGSKRISFAERIFQKYPVTYIVDNDGLIRDNVRTLHL